MIDAVEMIIRQAGHPDRVVRLHEGGTRIGRAEDNDIVLSDVGVSRRHAKVVVAPSSVHIEDLGSGNGTFHHGRRIESHALVDGDEILIDPFALIFRIRGRDLRPDDGENGPMARLDVLHGDGMTESSFGIGARGVTMGRSETRDIVVPDPASSRHHCTIFPQDGRFYLRDMGSANGVYVNGGRVDEVALVDGDRIRIGNTEMRFVIGDSTRVAGAPPTPARGGDWHAEISPADHEVSLSLPAPPPEDRTSIGSTALQSLPWVAFGGAVALFVLFLVVVVVGAGLFVIKQRTGGPPPAAPPAWTLTLPADVPDTPVPDLFREGIAATKRGDSSAALQRFYRSLLAEPGNPSAERLAYVAGEHVVLDALAPVVDARAEERAEPEARKQELLSKRRYRWARRALEKDHRDDPEVREAMGWGLSEREEALQVRLAEAQERVAARELVEGIAAFREVLDEARDPMLRRTARSGLSLAERELARRVADRWRDGVRAQADGRVEDARRAFTDVLAVDPTHPTAQIRLERLGSP